MSHGEVELGCVCKSINPGHPSFGARSSPCRYPADDKAKCDSCTYRVLFATLKMKNDKTPTPDDWIDAFRGVFSRISRGPCNCMVLTRSVFGGRDYISTPVRLPRIQSSQPESVATYSNQLPQAIHIRHIAFGNFKHRRSRLQLSHLHASRPFSQSCTHDEGGRYYSKPSQTPNTDLFAAFVRV